MIFTTNSLPKMSLQKLVHKLFGLYLHEFGIFLKKTAKESVYNYDLLYGLGLPIKGHWVKLKKNIYSGA